MIGGVRAPILSQHPPLPAFPPEEVEAIWLYGSMMTGWFCMRERPRRGRPDSS